MIRRGMAKEPNRRFPDCRELIAAARSALAPAMRPGGPMLPTGPSSGPNPIGPASGPNPLGPPSGPNPMGPPGYPRRPGDTTPYQPMRPGYPQQGSGEPMRLRPPVPAGASAFTPERGRLSRWGLPILVGLAAVVVIVVLVIVFTGNGNRSGGSGGGGQTSTSLPTVQVGPDSGGNQSELPTNFPGQPSN